MNSLSYFTNSWSSLIQETNWKYGPVANGALPDRKGIYPQKLKVNIARVSQECFVDNGSILKGNISSEISRIHKFQISECQHPKMYNENCDFMQWIPSKRSELINISNNNNNAYFWA